MDNYKINNSAQTVGYFTASIFATALLVSPPALASDHHQILMLQPAKYNISSISSTFDQYSNIFTGEFSNNYVPFVETITDFYAMLLSSQEQLEPEFEQVLHENLWDLYES